MTIMVCAETAELLAAGDPVGFADQMQGLGCKNWIPLTEALTQDATAEALGLGAADLSETSVLVAGGLISLVALAASFGVAVAFVKRAERNV